MDWLRLGLRNDDEGFGLARKSRVCSEQSVRARWPVRCVRAAREAADAERQGERI